MKQKGLNSLVGLISEKRRALIDIRACKAANEVFPHTLLTAVGGVGKTMFARAIAEELDYHFVEREAFSLKTPSYIAELFVNSNREAINKNKSLLIFIDEVHRLTNRLQEVFYYPMKEWRISFNGSYVNLNPFTMMAATTRKDMLDEASFVQRFQNVWEINRYHIDHICEIISHIFLREKMFFDPNNIRKIASRCLGIPRQANNLAIKVRNHALSRGSRTITEQDINEVFILEEIDSIGLSNLHTRYLYELLKANGEPKGLKSLAGKLSQHEDVIVGSVEPILLTLGFVDIHRGRILTEIGRKHLTSAQS